MEPERRKETRKVPQMGTYHPPQKSTLADYEREKRQRLDNLKRQNRADRRAFEEINKKTYIEQVERAKTRHADNPLKNDEAALYNANLSRVRKNYLYQRQ